MIVIGFTGPAGAGKDTAGQMLADYLRERRPGLNVRIQAWADKLKVAAAQTLRLLPEHYQNEETDGHVFADEVAIMDHFKVHGHVVVSLGPGLDETVQLSGREFLERFGTEGGRNVYGDDHWINLALPPSETPTQATAWRAANGFPSVVIDTSTRFPNEVARIREWGGQIWRVDRAEADLRNAISGHASRAGIPASDCDVLIENLDTLDDLRNAVIEAADERIVLPV